MPDPTQNPQLGYGKPSEQSIDTVNQWMRASPWYNDLLKSWGQDPRNVHLNNDQKKQVVRAAQAQGVVVDEGKMEVDPSGNFNPKGHKLRNTLIVAGIAGATIATMGAAGAFSGTALGPATAANMAATSAAASSVPASLAGLTAAELATIPASLGGTLVATTGGSALAPLSAGSMIPGGTAATTTTAATGGVGSKLANYGRNMLTDRGSEAVGSALGASAQSQAANRGTMAELMLDQNSDLERQLLAREQEKRDAQSNSYSNMMMGQHAANWEPRAGPYAPTQVKPMSAEQKAAGTQLYEQALKRMNMPDLQNPTGMPDYNNLSKNPEFQNTLHSGKLEKAAGIGSWAVPLAAQLLRRTS